jgi:hypothetical protein
LLVVVVVVVVEVATEERLVGSPSTAACSSAK